MQGIYFELNAVENITTESVCMGI